MAHALPSRPFGGVSAGPWGPRVALAVLLLAVVALIWWAAGQQGTITRKPADTVLVPVMPPAPTPPPPVEQPKPEEVQPEEVPPVPVDQPQPTPQQPAPPSPTNNAAPSAAPSAPGNAVSIDGAAQSGGDAFNIGSGPGGGRMGAGGIGGGGLARFNAGAYASYLAGELTRVVRSDNELRSQPMRVRVRLWIDAGGRITRVEPAATDKAQRIRTVLTGRSVRAPDASLAMPVLVTLNIARGG